LLLAVTAGGLIVWYGLTRGGLPGGNSMVVRWQYWQATGQMYGEHPLTGVGPGNFQHFYPRYKAAEALESVADPHNFLLSFLAQYGPLGLVGFLAMVFVPLWLSFPGSTPSSPQTQRGGPSFRLLSIVCLIAVSMVLLIIRPLIWKMPPGGSPVERQAAILILYVMPTAVFVTGFVLLAVPFRLMRPASEKKPAAIISAAVFSAILGLLVHNLIDFAIFEPGVWTAFWALVASLVAMEFRRQPRSRLVLQPFAPVRALITAGGLVVIFAYLYYAFIPPMKASAKAEQSMQNIGAVHELLHQAAEADRLDPATSNLNGRLYLQHYKGTGSKDAELLEKAAECFQAAIKRNKANFKNFENLSVVYNLLAKISAPEEKSALLAKAESNARQALERYPECGRLHFELAEICEQSGDTKEALEHYKEAVRIEDSFRGKFRSMYPEEQRVISRLGEKRYQGAKRQIEELSGELP
jgi:hypothetical protein